VIFRIDGESGARQYLNASLDYLNSEESYRRMQYPFPSVVLKCLLCGEAGCSRWKGYYSRQVICILMGYAGPIAIHLAQCRTRGVDYTYWPDVLIPYHRPSIPTLKVFFDRWKSNNSIRLTIDEVVGQIDQEIFISISVAYGWLVQILKAMILNHSILSIRSPSSLAVSELRNYSTDEIHPLFDSQHNWREAGRQINIHPP
jgi:hypothetical protein